MGAARGEAAVAGISKNYTCSMASPLPVEPKPVNILVLDQEGPSATALRQVLDSEGWRVRIVGESKLLLDELKSGEWSLVIANICAAGTGVAGLFDVAGIGERASRKKAGECADCFLVPEMAGSQFVGTLENARLPYVVRPYHLHDFLEKVSDLLVEVNAIAAPLRQVRYEFGGLRKKKREASRTTSMFASRDSYSYSEEEIAEYEKQESENSRNKRGKLRTNLGDPNR